MIIFFLNKVNERSHKMIKKNKKIIQIDNFLALNYFSHLET